MIKVCTQCKTEFDGKNNQNFCSLKCKNKYHNSNRINYYDDYKSLKVKNEQLKKEVEKLKAVNVEALKPEINKNFIDKQNSIVDNLKKEIEKYKLLLETERENKNKIQSTLCEFQEFKEKLELELNKKNKIIASLKNDFDEKLGKIRTRQTKIFNEIQNIISKEHSEAMNLKSLENEKMIGLLGQIGSNLLSNAISRKK
jgi:uncharacterized phage infection (PIP) family protein YhgE